MTIIRIVEIVNQFFKLNFEKNQSSSIVRIQIMSRKSKQRSVEKYEFIYEVPKSKLSS